ncbi:hypothetical protein EHRUM1_09480 [Ehrlichia ruminantium]|nr:hypothetical protein EHRUM1_09480 [Ehrlichia ruminantium]
MIYTGIVFSKNTTAIKTITIYRVFTNNALYKHSYLVNKTYFYININNKYKY